MSQNSSTTETIPNDSFLMKAPEIPKRKNTRWIADMKIRWQIRSQISALLSDKTDHLSRQFTFSKFSFL